MPEKGETYNGKLTASQLSQVRMLTEVECERLQGFPDNYTRYGIYDGERKEIAKIHRYALLGNAVSVPVVRKLPPELGKRLLYFDNPYI
ncbi:MAG: DNA cytosine methyltransferase [Alistipes putredinis]|uniref:DNA cytosine methyltransferase n=1 Tax=Alistipes putredinis TaxID=28117 RepID=UPI0039A363AF